MKRTFILKEDWGPWLLFLIFLIAAIVIFANGHWGGIFYLAPSLLFYIYGIRTVWKARWCNTCQLNRVKLNEPWEDSERIRYKCSKCGSIKKTNLDNG